jgi:major type 1 subunit fimbrin (pilin)
MKRTYLALAALTSTLVMSAAQASDGTVNFTGVLKDATCTISVNGVQGTTGTVTLPTLSAASLGTTGATGGATAFTIGLSGCTATGLANTVMAYFEAGSGVDPTTKNISNATGDAANVQLQLLDHLNRVITPGDRDSQIAFFLGRNNPVMPYSVQYIATATSGPGSVVGSVTYSIIYN